MTDRDFVYWLQGFFEVQSPTSINEEQTKLIKDHLALVFNHVIESGSGGVNGQTGLIGTTDPNHGVYGNYSLAKMSYYEDLRKGYSSNNTNFEDFKKPIGISC